MMAAINYRLALGAVIGITLGAATNHAIVTNGDDLATGISTAFGTGLTMAKAMKTVFGRSSIVQGLYGPRAALFALADGRVIRRREDTSVPGLRSEAETEESDNDCRDINPETGIDLTKVPNHFVIVHGGVNFKGRPFEIFSGTQGSTLYEASSAVPHGQVWHTTAGAIRGAGGTVKYFPEIDNKLNKENPNHVNICIPSPPFPFIGPQETPVPRDSRWGKPNNTICKP